jgi:hypothetical protein
MQPFMVHLIKLYAFLEKQGVLQKLIQKKKTYMTVCFEVDMMCLSVSWVHGASAIYMQVYELLSDV